MLYTAQQILALAPDVRTRNSAYNFARPRQWIELEGNENLLWGTCKTYQRKYKTWVALPQKRFKCSCKSPMPCRHALGMLLIYIHQSDSFRVTYDVPVPITNWLEGKKQTPKLQSSKQVEQNRQIRLRNWEKRIEAMRVGLDEIERWLLDVMEQGLASLEGQTTEYWESLSSRMVNHKLSSIARRIRQIPEWIAEEEDWLHRVLIQLGEIYLIVQGFRNMGKMPDSLQKELLNLAGVNHKKETLLEQKGRTDNWIVLGQTEQIEEKLRVRRTWLLGEQHKQWALFVDFAWGRQTYDTEWKVGTRIHAELVYYPSAYPLRAIAKSFEYLPTPVEHIASYPNSSAFLGVFAKAIAANPWLHTFPVGIRELIPQWKNDILFLVDNQAKALKIQATDTVKWKLVALSGGNNLCVFGTWQAEQLHPLSVWVDDRFVIL